MIEISDKNSSEIENATLPVAIEFWSENCPECRAFTPLFEKIAASFSGKYIFAKANIAECPRLADRFDVMALPALVAVDGAAHRRTAGAMDEISIKNFLRLR